MSGIYITDWPDGDRFDRYRCVIDECDEVPAVIRVTEFYEFAGHAWCATHAPGDARILAAAQELHQLHLAHHGGSHHPDDTPQQAWDRLTPQAQASYLRTARRKQR